MLPSPSGVRVRVARFLDGDFLRHGALLFGGTAVVSLMNYGFHWYVSRHLSVPEYGAIAALIAGLSIFSIPATIATTFIVKLSAELRAAGDLALVGALARRASTIAACVSIVVFGVIVVARHPIATYLRLDDPAPVVIVGLGLVAGLILPGARGILQGLQRFDWYVGSLACEGITKLGVGVGLVAVGRSVGGAAVGLACAAFTTLLFTETIVRRLTPHPRASIHIDRRRAAQSLGGVTLAYVAIGLLCYVDLVLAKHFLSPFAAGTYVAVGLAGKVFLFIGTFLPAVVLPKAALIAARGDRATSVLARAAGITGLMFALGLGLYMFAPRLILHALVGSAYDGGLPYVFPYAFAMAVLAFTNLLVTYRISTHDFGFVVPLLVVALGEVAAIYIWHSSILAIVRSLVIGDLIAVCVVAVGLLPSPSPVAAPQPAAEAP
jgi:O-antigen/teichoic acid export membrane protein